MSAAHPPAAPAAAKSPASSRDSSQRIYSIAELAREFAITARTMRFYEDEGLLKPKRHGLTRLYSTGDRTKLGWILRGKRLGFSLAEIKQLLDLYQVDRTGVQQLKELLRRSRAHIAELERKRRDLDTHIDEFRDVEQAVAKELRQRGVDPDRE
jgi:DNA-binding transcriptional MerR regulator